MKHHETNQDNLHKCMNAKFGLTIQLFCHPHHLVDLQVLLVLDEDPEELPQGLQPNAHGLLLADHWWTTRCWLTWIHIIIRHDNVTMCSCHLQWPATKIEQSNNEQWTWTRMQQWTVNSEQWTVHTDNNKHMLQIWSMQHKSQGSLREKYCSTPFGMARSIRWT